MKKGGSDRMEEKIFNNSKWKRFMKITAVEQKQNAHYFDTYLYSSVIVTLGKLVGLVIK